MRKLKGFVRKLIWGHRSDSKSYLDYYAKRGMKIGERVRVYEATKTYIDETRPWLISIGNDVVIARGVTILTHGYDWCVLAKMHGTVLGSAGEVCIGNNVFIGMDTMILKGVHIGNNVIIGAKSVVTKDIPDNCVAVGNPARVVMSIDEYYAKRLDLQKKEAFEIYRNYVEKMGKEPPMEIYDEFFWLFFRRDEEIPEKFKRQMCWHDRGAETMVNFQNTQPEFDGYEAFLAAARAAMNSDDSN